MQMWMNDPTNVDKLNSLKPESRRPAGDGKRRFNGDSSSDRSSPLDTLDDGSNDGSAKKARGPVSDEQREALNIAFALDPFPAPATQEFLATELGLDVKTIGGWYNNHRLRLKQLHGVSIEALFASAEDTASAFDPTKFRILLAHRRMEMQGGAGFPFLPAAGLNPAALFNLPPRSDGLDAGLDLRFPPRLGGGDDDVISEQGSDKNGGGADDTEATPRSNRRKPAAPQWVNPDLLTTAAAEDGGADQSAAEAADSPAVTTTQQPINGVCVRNISALVESPKSDS